MKKTLLSIEAFLILAPLGLFVIYMSILQVIFGIPSYFISNGTDSEFQVVLAFIGNLAGLFAYFVILDLAWKTIANKAFNFGRKFYAGLLCGILASTTLFVVYDSLLSMFIVLPIAVIVIHFIYLQVKCINMPNKSLKQD